MKNNLLLIVFTFLCTTAYSQTVPSLPKEWEGTVAHANVGYGGNYNTDQQTSRNLQFNKYNQQRRLTILEQDGQIVKVLYETGTHSFNLVGTISADGKQMAVANENSVAILNLSPNSIMGCGSSRGGKANPSFEEWKTSYATWCVNLKPVK